MTAKDKIQLSEYNLAKMKKGGFEMNFVFEFSNFLSSTHSITEHLLYDYANEFDLPIPDKLYVKTFRELAEGNEIFPKNQKALDFIIWYKLEMETISNDHFKDLRKRRNEDVHKGASPAVLEFAATIISTSVSTLSTSLGYTVKTPGLYYSIPEIPTDIEPVEFCEKYLERLKKMVNDAERKFKSV